MTSAAVYDAAVVQRKALRAPPVATCAAIAWTLGSHKPKKRAHPCLVEPTVNSGVPTARVTAAYRVQRRFCVWAANLKAIRCAEPRHSICEIDIGDDATRRCPAA